MDYGEVLALTKLVCRKLKKNRTEGTIADELETEPKIIQQICEIAKAYAPDYNVEEIAREYSERVGHV